MMYLQEYEKKTSLMYTLRVQVIYLAMIWFQKKGIITIYEMFMINKSISSTLLNVPCRCDLKHNLYICTNILNDSFYEFFFHLPETVVMMIVKI